MSKKDFNYSRPCAVILREPEPTLSREMVIVTGGEYPAGAVLSKVGDKYTELDPASTNLVVLLYPVDASESDQKTTALARSVSIKKRELSFPEGMSESDQQTALDQLKKQHIIAWN